MLDEKEASSLIISIVALTQRGLEKRGTGEERFIREYARL